MTYKIDYYGRVYRSNGPTYGWTGSIGGLDIETARTNISNYEKRGTTCHVTCEQTGESVALFTHEEIAEIRKNAGLQS